MKKLYARLLLISFLVAALSAQTFAQLKSKTVTKRNPVKKIVLPGANEKSPPWKQLNARERLVEISTDYGVMIAKLYDSTPLHRDNFVKLVEQKFYDSLLFHRVISQFMIQGGDPTSKTARTALNSARALLREI